MIIDYKSHYDEAYWKHQKTYHDASGRLKVYQGPSLQWEGFVWIAQALSKILLPGRILDVGCGGGDLSANLLGLGYDCYGIEISEYAVEHCSSAMKGRILCADVTQIYSDPGTLMQYDNVIATDFLEHVYLEDLTDTFRFFLDQTRPGGLLFFLIAITRGEEFIAKKGEPIPDKWHETAISGHVHVRHPSFWRGFFQRSGLTIDWERMYAFQSLREQIPAWRDTGGWDHPFTWVLRKP